MAGLQHAPIDPPHEQPSETATEWRRMGQALRAHALPIALAAITVTLVVLALSLAAHHRYQATAHIVGDSSSTTDAGATIDTRGLTTNLTLLDTPAVRAAAARRVPGETAASIASKVSASVEPDANVIDITATTDSAASAAAVANATAEAFLEQRTAKVRAIAAQTSAALDAQLAKLPKTRDTADQRAAILRQLSDLLVSQANAGSDLQLAALAQAPSGPYSPKPVKNAVVAFLLALGLACLAVLARERLRPAVGGPRDLRRVLGLPVLADLPEPHGGRRIAGFAGRLGRGRRLRADTASRDTLHSLIGAVLVALPPGATRVLVVTSPGRDRASSRAAADLAIGLARAGQRTLALSTDLTAPALGQTLGVAPGRGLSRILAHVRNDGRTNFRPIPQADVDNLDVLPDEPVGGPGIGLLRPGAVETVFAALVETDYTYIVVDAPALVSAPETWLVARQADAIILACPERAASEELSDAREALGRLGVRVLGAVLVEGATTGETSSRGRVVAAPSPYPNGDGVDLDLGAEAEAQQLLERLRTSDRPLTVAQLCGTLGGASPATVRARLQMLEARGDVVRQGTGVQSNPYVYGPSRS